MEKDEKSNLEYVTAPVVKSSPEIALINYEVDEAVFDPANKRREDFVFPAAAHLGVILYENPATFTSYRILASCIT